MEIESDDNIEFLKVKFIANLMQVYKSNCWYLTNLNIKWKIRFQFVNYFCTFYYYNWYTRLTLNMLIHKENSVNHFVQSSLYRA